MLSRRLLRIKSMQAIYAHRQNPSVPLVGVAQNLKNSVGLSYTLYLYHFWAILQVAHYSLVAKQLQAKKRLRKNATQFVSTKITENPLILALQKDPIFQQLVKAKKFAVLLEKDTIKKLYQVLTKEVIYQNYIASKETSLIETKKVIKTLFKKVLLKNELYNSHLEDQFINWLDDTWAVTKAINHKIDGFKQNTDKPYSFLLKEIDWRERETFALELLHKTTEHTDELTELIEQQLKNWEIDRITQIDIILMKMALCEMLYFPTIPTKVSINEYIEISKIYSTPKSKDFINGILDKLMKKLKDEGRIQKMGRGLVEF